MRLVLPRAAAARTLLVAAALAALVTSVLLTGFVLYAQLLPVAGSRAAVAEAPPVERTLLVTSAAADSADALAAQDAAARELLGRPLAGARPAVAAGGYATGQQLPPGLAPTDGAAVVGFLPELPEHAELAAGRWPEPVAAGDPGGPVQAAVPVPLARTLGLAVGDRVEIVDSRTEDQPAPVELVGLWQPIDPADPYWRLLSAPLDRGGWGPFVVHPDEFAQRYRLLSGLEWLAVPDPAVLAEAGMPAVAADVQALSGDLIQQREDDPALDRSARLNTGLGELADRLAVAAVVHRSGMVLPAALLVVIAGFGLVLLARLLAAHRRGENALLRARGSSRWQLVRFTAAEALLVVAPAAVFGAPAGTWLVRVADRRSGDAAFHLAGDLARYGLAGPPLAWTVAVAAAAGCAVALALPAAGRGRTWVAEQQERSRPSELAVARRAGIDLALVVLAVLAWSQLRQYGTAVAPRDAGLGIDPLLVAAPVVGVLAATAVALRLLPLATRLGVRLAARRNAFPGLLGVWQADRRPHAGPVLLLVLAVATAVLAPAVVTTWQQSQRDQGARQVGADLRITAANPSAASGTELQAALPAATGLMPVHRSDIRVGDSETATLLAVASEPAAQVAQVRADLAPDGPEAMFGALRQGRPELAGVPLPDGARLTGRFQFDVPEPEQLRFLRVTFVGFDDDPAAVPVQARLPRPEPDHLAVHVRNEAGVIRSVQLGQPITNQGGRTVAAGGIELDGTGGLDIDVLLPPDATELVALGGGLSVTGWDPLLVPDQEADPVPVRWRWEDLRVVAADGTATPLQVPDDWQVHTPGDAGPEAPQPEPDGPGLAAATTLEPLRHYPGTVRFLLTSPPPELSAIPMVLTPDLREAAGAQVGDILTVSTRADGISSARLAGVVDAVPGTVDGSGALVDLAWLSTHQLLWQRPTPAVSEWWVAAPGGTGTAAVEELAWTGTVQDRRVETRRLLDDPLGTGVLFSLWAAAGAAALLAAFGLVVDSRATAVRRRRELAVLHTLGTSPAGLARALVVEQAVLAGLGVVAGALVGVAVAAAMGTSLVLTPAGSVPVPVPVLHLSPAQLATPVLGLFAVALALGALVARRARREVAAGALRIGDEG